MKCNICGGSEFEEHKTRGSIKCTSCRSIERTRVLALYLDKFAGLHEGQRVLHLAPESQLFGRLAKTIGPNYDVRDLNVDRYKSLRAPGITVKRFDLCTDLHQLPSDHYDLILHNHVLEHLPCNVTAVLWHLHRALKPGGLHMFSVPIFAGRYEESLVEMSGEERHERFHQWDHLRNFGRDDLPVTIGAVFDIEKQLKTSLLDLFPASDLKEYNIPESRWRGFSGANVLMLRKEDLKLRTGAPRSENHQSDGSTNGGSTNRARWTSLIKRVVRA